MVAYDEGTADADSTVTFVDHLLSTVEYLKKIDPRDSVAHKIEGFYLAALFGALAGHVSLFISGKLRTVKGYALLIQIFKADLYRRGPWLACV